jgi:hypothetical protein
MHGISENSSWMAPMSESRDGADFHADLQTVSWKEGIPSIDALGMPAGSVLEPWEISMRPV